jgi:hypothetical protein
LNQQISRGRKHINTHTLKVAGVDHHARTGTADVQTSITIAAWRGFCTRWNDAASVAVLEAKSLNELDRQLRISRPTMPYVYHVVCYHRGKVRAWRSTPRLSPIAKKSYGTIVRTTYIDSIIESVVPGGEVDGASINARGIDGSLNGWASIAAVCERPKVLDIERLGEASTNGPGDSPRASDRSIA